MTKSEPNSKSGTTRSLFHKVIKKNTVTLISTIQGNIILCASLEPEINQYKVKIRIRS